MQIAGVQGIGVDDPQVADPCAGQVLQHRTAEASGANDENPAARQRRLPLRADLLEQDLP